MNRLKAGAVLNLPDAETAKATAGSEARQIIQAQSADYQAYRQRLAEGVAPAEAATPASRQASGKVQAEVEDRKQAAAPAPDRLTLSKGGVKGSSPEEKLSKASEAKASEVRTAELKKNVDELKTLAEAAKAAPAAAAPAAVETPAPAPAVAAAPATAASVAIAMAAPAASAVAPAAAPASAVPVAGPAPAQAAEEPSFIGTLIDDPTALGGAGLVLALLAGFGVFRYMKRNRKDSGETSFLESRLQPDSFFGVSGGQRIDTREGTNTASPSSMSYSLSQLDAIGDVDPVAEADVYLAYGRDLQAEEILKEAMRGAPERLAIRTKLLEVYVKRRDAKGFESVALQLYQMTRGEGEEWAKAQELGQQIDPGNPLYRPGGLPPQSLVAGDKPGEPLGASTMPQSVLPSPSQFERMAAVTAVLPVAANAESELDLDLDLDLPGPEATVPPAPPEVTQPMGGSDLDAQAESGASVLELPQEAAAARSDAVPARDLSMDFDLSGISLDLGTPGPAAGASAAPEEPVAEEAPQSDDPFERKLELAEEFRQIGDLDGARDLLDEVIAQTEGAIQSKARNMLERLG
jgi:pilus assembly protein FimV